MRTFRRSLLAGVATIAIGLSGAALAQSSNTHVMTVQLPYGGTAQIRYTGDVPPQVTFSEGPAALAPLPSLFGTDSPFAALDRISVEMDRRMAAMLRQAGTLAAQAGFGQPSEAALRNLPPGGRSYSFVSTMSGNGVCTQSVEITAQGNGRPPRIVRHSSGNCGPQEGAGGSVNLPAAPAPVARPDVVWTSADGAKPYAGLVREISAAPR
ncbi:MAG TPA: hypothetical protein VGQ90_10445 [Stellaceae bacterium]|nr:hypothetical protein [Stellaceae bacterium]